MYNLLTGQTCACDTVRDGRANFGKIRKTSTIKTCGAGIIFNFLRETRATEITFLRNIFSGAFFPTQMNHKL